MSRRVSEPERMGDLLPRVLDELGLDAASTRLRLIRVWDAALGPRLAPHCRPEGVQRGVAWATVPDSAWMQRVQLETPRILAGLAEALGDEAPRELRLRLSPDRGSAGPKESSG